MSGRKPRTLDDPRRDRLPPLVARWTSWRIWLDRPHRDAAEKLDALPPLHELLAWYAAQRLPVLRSDRPHATPSLRLGRLLAALAGVPVAAARLLMHWLWRLGLRQERRR